MSRWLPALTGAVVGAAGATLARWLLDAQPPGGADRWTRTNHAGAPVSLLEGPAAGAGLVAGGAASAVAAGQPKVAAAVAVAGGAGLGFGLLDDLTEDLTDRRKGLRGHLSAMAHGTLTTGGAKVLGIGLGSLAASALLPRSGATRLARTADWCATGAFIAVSANFVNLLDLRPGRALKAAAAHVPGLVAAGGPAAGVAGTVVGTAAAVAPGDLAGRDMLGDAGANALGAVLAVGVASAAPPPVRWALLALEAGLTVASEKISFTRVIESTPVLREIDAWGRPDP
ncbi:MAG: hypothetical protein FWF02_10705 [Micrococcales bacterium]|nr:hypothetical protein [Micrococcales bacterium]MCL2668156.1 hypothetical protein [Micrococcales bacterium]